LRSQVDQVEELQIQIIGGDRQILKGYIPSVFLASTRAVYQGLHLRQIQLQGENIRINLGQILKGKPLQLLEPICVTGEVLLLETDLQASLASTLLSQALTDLLTTLLNSQEGQSIQNQLSHYQIHWETILLATEQFIIRGSLNDNNANHHPLVIQSGLHLVDGQTLRLHSLKLEGIPDLINFNIEEFIVDLGTDVSLKALSLTSGQLSCQGQLKVLP
jgi:hypothetical protein